MAGRGRSLIGAPGLPGERLPTRHHEQVLLDRLALSLDGYHHELSSVGIDAETDALSYLGADQLPSQWREERDQPCLGIGLVHADDTQTELAGGPCARGAKSDLVP